MEEGGQDKITFTKKSAWLGLVSYLLLILVMIIVL